MIARIESEADIAEGVTDLIRLDPRFKAIVERTGLPPVRRQAGGFAALVRIVTDQQISLHAGKAIWGRTVERLGDVDPKSVLRSGDSDLIAAGQSRSKVRTIRALATAACEGSLDFDSLDELSDHDAEVALCAVSGIGPWTAHVYMLVCMGRPDAWPAGDVGLQHALKGALQLPQRPGAREASTIAEGWRPVRAIAARVLWSWYRIGRTLPSIEP